MAAGTSNSDGWVLIIRVPIWAVSGGLISTLAIKWGVSSH
jgi:hypothetical protein